MESVIMMLIGSFIWAFVVTGLVFIVFKMVNVHQSKTPSLSNDYGLIASVLSVIWLSLNIIEMTMQLCN